MFADRTQKGTGCGDSLCGTAAGHIQATRTPYNFFVISATLPAWQVEQPAVAPFDVGPQAEANLRNRAARLVQARSAKAATAIG